ncbi:hypothetical protein B0H19DRAFT_433872 [Mycena capillaripes]|nr:hypothetical protein B0H19DRAFT_433872 [Mycena capillaripes]
MGKKSSAAKKASTRRDRTDGKGDQKYEEAPVRFCSMNQCFNYKNLKECGRCKVVCYCSVECQRKNWKEHKPTCDHNVAEFAKVNGEEPLMQRNLRHWVARFDATLHNACIRGLRLKYEWERIDQGGLMIWMEPRPHPNVGSRWRILNAGMFKNDAILNLLGAIDMADRYRDEVLPMHNEARERLRNSSGGTADYAPVIIIAGNIGPDALEGDHPMTMRFTPIDIYQATAANMDIEKYEGDWLQDLKDQVHSDSPMKHLPPSQV